jgi:cation diffusion facilitator CzcD-associated flavoprotein CzcO
LSNIYPGVKCDIPSDVYQSTFAPNTEWSQNYSPGSEIRDYWQSLVKKFGVDKLTQYETSVTRAEWDNDKAKWRVTLKKGDVERVEEADYFITATGHFADPRLPDYEGLHDFEGHLRHTSNWDPTFDPVGKKIAVIGNGASGLQVVPQLQKVAKHLDHYARSRTWVAKSFGGENLSRGPEPREVPPQDPEGYLKFRKELEAKSYGRFSIIIKGEKNRAAQKDYEGLLAERLGDRSDLLEVLKPDFPPNCRRLTPGPGYIEALTQPNVGYIETKIKRFTKTGIELVDGTHNTYDAIICSTGADISFKPPFPIVANGVDLQEAWAPGGSIGFPDSYLGISAPNFPNFALVLGPNSSGQGGTVPHAIENQVTWVAKVLRKISTEGIRSMAATQAATNDFRAYCESFFPRTVMSETCSSWYNGGIPGGRIHGIWPGSGTHVNIVRRNVRFEDFEYTYLNESGNRFAWFGNGFSLKDWKVANGEEEPETVGFTNYLKKESVTGEVDLRAYHELWYDL